jgi:hypothetical protein
MVKENKSIIFYYIILFYSILFYSILFYSILFYISGGERGQGDGRPFHLLSHNQPRLSSGFRDLELTYLIKVMHFFLCVSTTE